jgi:hypothetical protein
LSQCEVRNFSNGDEKLIVELFNEAHAGYGGYVPRTVEYWRWSCLKRPDVDERGVFLAFDGQKLRGYIVAGSSGNIWEYCVANGEEQAARALLAEALKYLEAVGVSSANVNVPCRADVVDALVEAGFGEVRAERMFITTLSPASLLRALLPSTKETLLDESNDHFTVRLHHTPLGVESEFSVSVRRGSVEVVEGPPPEHTVVLDLAFMDFLSVIFEGSSARRLLLARKLRIKPFWKLRAALKFLSAVRLTDSWFFPLSDFG